MATPRTATTKHKRMRRQCLARDKSAGITHCPICGTELDYETPERKPNKAEADEIVPYALTGTTSTDPDDWQTICAQCNQRKGSKVTPTRDENVNLFPHSRAWFA